MKAKIAPSLACADFWQLGQEIAALEAGGADFFHADIMDGDFVPNFCLGTDIISSIRPRLNIPLEVHLQAREPGRFVKVFADLGVDIFTFHFEACDRLHQMAKMVKESGMKMGVALNPCTPISVLETALEKIDMIVMMTVEPGFAGQTFIDPVLEKIAALRRLCNARGIGPDIAVDGNINTRTIPLSAEAGANVFVLGTSSIFTRQGNLEELTRRFKEISTEAVSRALLSRDQSR